MLCVLGQLVLCALVVGLATCRRGLFRLHVPTSDIEGVDAVLHRLFPAVRETPVLEGLFRRRKSLAERVGFEPTVRFPAHTLSKRAP
jgi:hypothetical protein